jgi:predicted phage tail protein
MTQALGTPAQRSGSLEAFGVTSEAEAVTLGYYALLNNRLNLRMAEWQANVEAVHCLPGDVVGLTHDLPRWGQSGRFLAAAGTSVTLDQEVELLDNGTVYVLTARLDKVSRLTGTITAIEDDIIYLSGYSGTTNFKRLVTPTVDAEVIFTGRLTFK